MVLAAVAALGLLGVAGVAVQAIAQPANHPQAEMAQSAVANLNSGAQPQAVIPDRSVDIAQSNDPYLIVLDGQRSVLASSASLDGQVVLPPAGVFDYVTAHGEDRVTWTPANGVRSWIVVDSFRGGYVVAGRSPADGEAAAYLFLFWAGLAAIGLAGLAGVALVITR
ncbi:MAG TPA: hypothetical protein VI384_00600 [Candidatus Dormibacteraeota bacterium]